MAARAARRGPRIRRRTPTTPPPATAAGTGTEASSLKRAWHAQPLRSRLALITTALLTIGLLVVSLSVTSLLYSHLLSQVDTQLRVTAQTVGTQGVAQLRTGMASPMPSTYFVDIHYADGTNGQMISAEASREYGIPQVDGLISEPLHTGEEPALYTVMSSVPGKQWRVTTLPITNRDTGESLGVVTIGLPLSQIMDTVEQTRIIIALADTVVIIGGALAAAYLVRRSLRTLQEMEQVAGKIAQGDLSARVPTSEPASTEVGSLQRALNVMLNRNEHAFAVQVMAQERMTRFVSDASHELRTPLAAIRGYGELYHMGGVPAERMDEIMDRITSEASRMGRLVDDLLQLARMDEGRELNLSRVNVTELARAALSDMTVLSPERECALTTLDGEGDAEPVWVRGDRDRLAQVLTNLLGNVVRHTPEGSPVEIAVGLCNDAAHQTDSLPEQPESWAIIEVRDHGPGVPAADASKVFERFYRADTSRNRQTGGSGLGLAIVAAIIGRHGGSVSMRATPGGGATVHIALPVLVDSPASA